MSADHKQRAASVFCRRRGYSHTTNVTPDRKRLRAKRSKTQLRVMPVETVRAMEKKAIAAARRWYQHAIEATTG